ncbi:hypothetical protein BH762_gp017 [Gordonia phage OneUp]|uniref:Uncharacterized protein n=1 Tax=Gordonia phage OneUp TaxID=1838074 RepID=A0A160DF39_9CAUD|nr:hypothetical protein BH762_gp017 [Gordonia phage OneUp]ANA86501.1 hypothetical protein PBI_ONEUP_168 [Gordonia phage OneUp]
MSRHSTDNKRLVPTDALAHIYDLWDDVTWGELRGTKPYVSSGRHARPVVSLVKRVSLVKLAA